MQQGCGFTVDKIITMRYMWKQTATVISIVTNNDSIMQLWFVCIIWRLFNLVLNYVGMAKLAAAYNNLSSFDQRNYIYDSIMCSEWTQILVFALFYASWFMDLTTSNIKRIHFNLFYVREGCPHLEVHIKVT